MKASIVFLLAAVSLFGLKSSAYAQRAPEAGYIFPVGNMQGYLNLKAYGEFDQENRPAGWNTWLTFAISPAAPTEATPTRHLITK